MKTDPVENSRMILDSVRSATDEMMRRHDLDKRLERVSSQGSYGCTIYKVRLLSGEWPSDDDLVNWCDHYSHNWGGKVEKYVGNELALVKVYID